jgi:hypothetical protein
MPGWGLLPEDSQRLQAEAEFRFLDKHCFRQKEGDMIRAFVFIQAEPARVQELVAELAGMRLDASTIKEVHAVTGRWDLIALIESPDVVSLGD